MNSETKMYIINSEGKRIEKIVPPELYSNYISMGWKVIEKEIKEPKNLTKIEKKFNKEVD